MDTPHKKRTTRTVAAATAALVGSGLAVAAPAEAVPTTEPADVAGVAHVPVTNLTRAAVTTRLVIHRSGRVAASASIAAAPQVLPAKAKKKKVKKKYRSRRS
jgi:hypothetical protein